MTVSSILSGKPTVPTIILTPDETIGTLADRLSSANIGAVVVGDGQGKIEGIISERDIVHGLAEHGSDLLTKPISTMMTRTVQTCAPDDSVVSAMDTMSRYGIRHLPVVEDGRLVGIISMRDILRSRV